MCSGRRRRNWPKVSVRILSLSPLTPKMRSRLMLSNPLSLRILKACRAVAASCRRLIQRSMSSERDWTPILMRLTPIFFRASVNSRPRCTMSSGFTSTVNSVKPLTGSALRMDSKKGRGITDGVPPPIYNVLTFCVLRICSLRSLISSTTFSV